MFAIAQKLGLFNRSQEPGLCSSITKKGDSGMNPGPPLYGGHHKAGSSASFFARVGFLVVTH